MLLETSLTEQQRANLYAGASNIVQLRTDIALLLRSLRTAGVNSNAIKASSSRTSCTLSPSAQTQRTTARSASSGHGTEPPTCRH